MTTQEEAQEFWKKQLLIAKNDKDKEKIIEKLSKLSLKAGEALQAAEDVKSKVNDNIINKMSDPEQPTADLSSLLAEKEKLVKIIQNFDDEDAKNDLFELEKQISFLTPKGELRYYFSEKFQQKFIWDISAGKIQFDDGIFYTIEEINEIYGYNNNTRELIHQMKKNYNVKLIQNNKLKYLGNMKGAH